MSEFYQEQQSLLCDDFSDDEFNSHNYSPRTTTRMRPVIYSGRVKNQMKGAVAILKIWPEHWWSTLKYWWMGLGMIAIIVLIVYNSVFALSALPLTYTKAIKPQMSFNTIDNISLDQLSRLEIYIHVFDDVDLNDILPYVEIMSNKYKKIKFNLVVVINEKYEKIDEMNDETKNHVAFNSLWTDESLDKNHRVLHTNLIITYVSLNKYLDDSPLHKFWKNLSQEFVEFLVRVLSIWEKGGIALNPTVLTPSSPNPIYMGKIQNLLNAYKENQNKKDVRVKQVVGHTKQSHIPKKKLNNIRDIIEALEIDDKYNNNSLYNLTEAENKAYSVKVNISDEREFMNNKKFSVPLSLRGSEILLSRNKKATEPSVMSHRFERKVNSSYQFLTEIKSNLSSDGNHEVQSNSFDNTTKHSLLPIFLDYLFPKKTKLSFATTNTIEDLEDDYKIKSFRKNEKETIINPRHEKGYVNSVNFNVKNDKQELFSNYKMEKSLQAYDDTDTQLTVDLKGNIIASNTACHAFVGNLLSNAINYSEGETVTSFIITELTYFCKGVMSSCKGIDVISL